MSIALKDTLNLPQTNFPMKANLVEREPKRLELWGKDDLYSQIQRKNKNRTGYILHDGPPFTNGEVHIGTALNKILKDTILRYKSMKGFRTPFVPGWDCHGLPIEHKVSTELREKKKDLSVIELRQACAEYSKKYIKIQRAQFERLGVLANWDRDYKTMDPGYEAEVLRSFAVFVEKGLVYRSKKPIYWSIPCETALAEFEIEYRTHISPSIYVKFQIKDTSKFGVSGPLFVVIWTTTPWTLPANLAVAVNKNLEYQVISSNNENYLVAKELAETFIKACELKEVARGGNFSGESLEGVQAQHPFIDRLSSIVLGDHVTIESGTGCVHIAPGHGPEDYAVAQKYNLEIYCPIDDKGKYIDDGRIPESLTGVTVLETKNKCPANDEVIKFLRNANSLLHIAPYEHSYPHCWRSKTPVIYRAMDQWFLSIDKDNMRSQVMEVIHRVKWIPHWGENRIRGAVESRPDWCISRQRAWGMPIPAFYDEDGKPLLSADIIRQIANIVEKEGTDAWFKKSAEELLKDVKLPTEFKNKKLKKGEDTLDVWLESGSSHQAVLKKNSELSWPADLYFEGSDQHRGWFQSSLWTSVVLNGEAPFKNIITHGFVVNEKGKISKSDTTGKPQTSDTYVQKYGADIIRLWINSEDYRSDVPISDNIFAQIVQTYRTLRNTLRFQLGNLYDFKFEKNAIAFKDLTILDKWALHETAVIIEGVSADYENYEFHKAFQKLNRFCSVVLSATYHDLLKDRLYTYAPNWPERRSSQTAIYLIFQSLVKLLAPILTFTTEEAYAYFQNDTEVAPKSIHLEEWPSDALSWKNAKIASEVEDIFKVRSMVNEKLEVARQAKLLGQSLDAQVIISGPSSNSLFKLLKKYESLLPEFFIVSQVRLNEATGDELQVLIKPAEGVRCPRSWRWVPSLVYVENFGEVSPRCREALLQKYSPQTLNKS